MQFSQVFLIASSFLALNAAATPTHMSKRQIIFEANKAQGEECESAFVCAIGLLCCDRKSDGVKICSNFLDAEVECKLFG